MRLRRILRIGLEILGACLAGLAILFAILAYRLTHEGPIHLAFLSPYIENAFNEADQPYRIAIEDTVLTWGGWDHALEVRAVRLHIQDRGGRELAILPEVGFAFSGRALMRGLIAPVRIDILAPHLRIERQVDGRLAFGATVLEAGNDAGSQGDQALMAMIGDLLQPPDPQKPTGYLESVALRQGRLDITDAITGRDWQAQDFLVVLRRGASGPEGELTASLPQFGATIAPAQFAAQMAIDTEAGIVALDGRITGFDLSRLPVLEPVLADLAGFRIAVEANVKTRIAFDGSVGPIAFSLIGGAGEIELADWLEEPLAVKSAAISGLLDRSLDLIRLDRFDLDLGGPRIGLTGVWDGAFTGKAADGGIAHLDARMSLRDLPVDRLAKIWPRQIAVDARAWVVPNITAGMVSAADLELELALPGDFAAVELRRLSGTLATEGLTVHYLRPLPPITDGIATGRFDAKSFEADIASGAVGEIAVTGGHLAITGLDRKDQTISVKGSAMAPAVAALTLLDHPRLDYVKGLGIAPQNASGRVAAEIGFDFPAAKDLDIDDVKIAVAADLDHVGLRKIRFGQDLTDSDLHLTLDNDGMDIAGSVVFAGMNLDFAWRQNFDRDAPFAEKLHVAGSADAAQRAALGFDLRPWLDGPCACDIAVVNYANGRSAITGKMDLAAATIDLPFIHWRKEAGAAASGDLAVEMLGQQVTEISHFALAAPDLKAEGRAGFDPEGHIETVELPVAQFGRSDLLGVVIGLGGGKTEVKIRGGKLDAEPWLAETKAPKSDAELDAEEKTPQRPFAIAGSLDQIRIGKDRWLAKVKLDLVHDPLWWELIALQAQLPNGKALTLDYRPGDGGTHVLNFAAEDGGEALRVFDLYDGVKGGKLIATGIVKDDEPHRPLRGKMEMTSYRLLNAPFFARLFSLASVTGIVDLMTGEGFLFGGAKAKFTKTRGLIEIKKFRSAGPSIGFTAKGKIDLDRQKINLKGTITPAYLLNGLLNDIPLLGDIFSGGAGEGIFSITYAATGNLAEPKISTNPLSAVTPGILRDLFSDDGDDEDSSPTTPRPQNPNLQPGGKD